MAYLGVFEGHTMLSCVFLMGNLFVSDGDVMIAFDAMSHVERNGSLLVVGAGERQDGLDVSDYPAEMGVHTILAECAKSAEDSKRGFDFASM